MSEAQGSELWKASQHQAGAKLKRKSKPFSWALEDDRAVIYICVCVGGGCKCALYQLCSNHINKADSV